MISFTSRLMRIDTGFLNIDKITTITRANDGSTLITYQKGNNETGEYKIDTISPNEAAERINEGMNSEAGKIIDLTV